MYSADYLSISSLTKYIAVQITSLFTGSQLFTIYQGVSFFRLNFRCYEKFNKLQKNVYEDVLCPINTTVTLP